MELIDKKIRAKTCEAPYKGPELRSTENFDMKKKLTGEVNKFLWLIFHDLNLRELKTEIKSLQLRHLLKLIKQLTELIYIPEMDPHNLAYMVEILLEFEEALFDHCTGDYLEEIETLFFLLTKSLRILFQFDILSRILPK